jgi:IS30 family transposase
MSQKKHITRKRTWKQLNERDRIKIETLLAEKLTPKEIAKRMGRERTQESVTGILNRLERRYKSRFSSIFKSITMDNGTEFLDMKKLETSCRNPEERRTTCYYAHPYS